jgi:hypothetical protein
VSKSLAEIVVEARLATEADVDRAAAAAADEKVPLVVTLVRIIGVDELALVAAIRRQVRVPLVDPASVAPDPDALREAPRDVCRRLRALPLDVGVHGRHRVLRVAMADPTDGSAIMELEHITGCEIVVTLVPLSAVEEAIEEGYRSFVTEVVQRKKPFGGTLSPITQPMARPREPRPTPGHDPRDDGAGDGELTDAGEGGLATTPYHRLSDEADLLVRHQALLQLLVTKQVISEDEYEDAVRELLKRRSDER